MSNVVRISQKYLDALEVIRQEKDLENIPQTLRYILRNYLRENEIDSIIFSEASSND